MQRGRSRRWFDDHGWWLGDVTFDPGRNPGAYVVVGVTWMWDPDPDGDPKGWSFSERIRTRQEGEMIIYESEGQFAPLVRRYSELAADLVRRNRDALTDPQRATKIVNRRRHDDLGVLWGLAGRVDRARSNFEKVVRYADSSEAKRYAVARAQRDARRARELIELLDDTSAFRARIADEMRETRLHHKLAPDAELPAA